MNDRPVDRKRRRLLQVAALTGATLGLHNRIAQGAEMMAQEVAPDLILHNGRITTFDGRKPEVSAIALADGRVMAIGSDRDVMKLAHGTTQVVDLDGRRVIPGLNDSHTHLIRGGLNFNLELRWEGVPSLSIALDMLRRQAQDTPAPQWVRVVGGWSEFQFAEGRMPTLPEINKAAPHTPVFILHLYGRALLNRAALEVLGIGKDTPDPPGGVIERDASGNATGLFLAKPSALILYSTLARGPKLPYEYQLNSTRHYMREMNRLGITSVIDAGGGGQNFPDDYRVIQDLHDKRQLTVRIAYNLFAQKAGAELQSYRDWAGIIAPGQGDELLRMNGAGENLTWSAADFENFLEPRPELPPVVESELEAIVRFLVEQRWPFRIHATYDETIDRFLGVFEKVNRSVPFAGLRFIIDHAETISDRNIERVKALGGGIAIQHRMAFQGEYFVQRYGADAARQTPPITRMLAQEVPVGAGTDATRVASYNPWVALYWLVTGKTLGGLSLYGDDNMLDRKTALYLWTKGSSWFSGEQTQKGALTVGEYADLAVLSEDYFAVDDEDIKDIHAVMTVMGGRIVYASGKFSDHNPPLPPPMPDWSPLRRYGMTSPNMAAARLSVSPSPDCIGDCTHGCTLHGHRHRIAWTTPLPISDSAKQAFWGALGCSCFAI